MELSGLQWSDKLLPGDPEVHLDALYSLLDRQAVRHLGRVLMARSGALHLCYGCAEMFLLPDGSFGYGVMHSGFSIDMLPRGLGCTVILQAPAV